jgi:hypothetical protein
MLEYAIKGSPKEIEKQLFQLHANREYYDPTNLGFKAGILIENCIEFHKSNPIVWEIFHRLAVQVSKKKTHFGVAAIWERMRWELAIEIDNDLEYKLNNDYKAFYSRLFNEVAEKDFFTMRESIFDEVHYEVLAKELPCS